MGIGMKLLSIDDRNTCRTITDNLIRHKRSDGTPCVVQTSSAPILYQNLGATYQVPHEDFYLDRLFRIT
jgi:hypothetical protein